MSWLDKQIRVPSKIKLPNIGKSFKDAFKKIPKYGPKGGSYTPSKTLIPPPKPPSLQGTPLPVIHKQIVKPSSMAAGYGATTGICISGSLGGYSQGGYNHNLNVAYGPINDIMYVENEKGQIVQFPGPPWYAERPPKIPPRLGDTPDIINHKISFYMKEYRAWCDELAKVNEEMALGELEKLESLRFEDFYQGSFDPYDTNSTGPK